jgi:cytochrome c peroxidase
VPLANPVTPDKVQLGKALFWDEQLSSTRMTACATCHIPSAGGVDPRSALSQTIHPGADGLFGTSDDVVGSLGQMLSRPDGTYIESPEFGLDVQVTPRKTPTMIDAAYAPLLFWDGRATGQFDDPLTGGTVLLFDAALESQAAGPPLSDTEMGHLGRDWSDVAARVAASLPLALASDLDPILDGFVAGRTYPELFLQAFGSPGVTPERIAMAIATYERTLIADQTPLDAGPGALTPLEAQGRQLFNTKGRCNVCHNGPFLTDFAFKNTGVTPIFEDLGRGAISGNPADNGRFKTPDLRNIELRAPYFHDGSAKTLEEVVDFYDRGGDFHIGQAPAVAPIGFTPAEKAALVAFMKRPLTDPRVASETGPFTRPTLFSETNQLPELYGFGTAAPSGIVPRAIALEPQLVGNPSMTLAVADAVPFGTGFLMIDFAKGFTTFLGADVLLGLTPAMRLVSAGPMQGSGLGGGYNSVSISIPSDPTLIGLPVDFQWFVLAGNLSATSGIEAVLF